VDSTPIPAPDWAIPPGSGATGDGSLSDWVRTHAKLFADMPSGPPGRHLPRDAMDGSAWRVPPRTAGGSPQAHPIASVGAWALLMRGVAGFLAVLSVARI